MRGCSPRHRGVVAVATLSIAIAGASCAGSGQSSAPTARSAPTDAATAARPAPAPAASAMDSLLAPSPNWLPGAVDRFAGEFGLWVDEVDDTLYVRWLTETPAVGFLRVIGDGRELSLTNTPASSAHVVAFARPRVTELVLEYGASGGNTDRHLTTVWLDTGRRRPPPSVSNVDSVFVVSDLHGEYDRFTTLLRNAGLIDSQLRWSGGHAHLVVAGDVFDRGPDAIPILWLLYRLEREALAAGGNLHLVLGNHEIMVMLNDHRYVHPKELNVALLHGVPYWRLFDSRFSILGRWLATRPALLRIDRLLIAHGGVGESFLRYDVGSFADTLAAFIDHDLFRLWNDSAAVVQISDDRYDRWIDFFWGENSVFWHRAYVASDSLGDELRAVLGRMRADLHVVGHTPVPSIHARYDGSLLATNPYEFASEMLLLVREGREYRRFRYGLSGPPAPF